MAITAFISRGATPADLIADANAQLAPLLTERILEPRFDSLRNEPSSARNLYCTFTADTANSTGMVAPYTIVPFIGHSEEEIELLYDAYIVANSLAFTSPLFVVYRPFDGSPASATIGFAFFNPDFTQGAANWGYSTSGGGGDNLYENPNPTTIAVGGLPVGTTFPSGNTLQNTLNNMLYPYQAPAFSSFAITGQGPTVEVGYTIPATPLTFTWGTSQSANVAVNSIFLQDVTGGGTFAAGLANTGSTAQAVPAAPILRTAAASYVFRINGVNTNLGAFNRTYTVTWQWRLFYGAATPSLLSGAQILALSSSQLATGYPGNYLMGTGGYKYICFANTVGGQINTVTDSLTNFNVPMVTGGADPAYSNIDGGGFSYALVSVTNINGVIANYRVYRTLNVLGASITLVVT